MQGILKVEDLKLPDDFEFHNEIEKVDLPICTICCDCCMCETGGV